MAFPSNDFTDLCELCTFLTLYKGKCGLKCKHNEGQYQIHHQALNLDHEVYLSDIDYTAKTATCNGQYLDLRDKRIEWNSGPQYKVICNCDSDNIPKRQKQAPPQCPESNCQSQESHRIAPAVIHPHHHHEPKALFHPQSIAQHIPKALLSRLKSIPNPITKLPINPCPKPTTNPKENAKTFNSFLDFRLRLNADYDALLDYLGQIGVSCPIWAKEMIQTAMDIKDNPELSQIPITEIKCKKGSVVIEYRLEYNSASLLKLAVESMEATKHIHDIMNDVTFTVLEHHIIGKQRHKEAEQSVAETSTTNEALGYATESNISNHTGSEPIVSGMFDAWHIRIYAVIVAVLVTCALIIWAIIKMRMVSNVEPVDKTIRFGELEKLRKLYGDDTLHFYHSDDTVIKQDDELEKLRKLYGDDTLRLYHSDDTVSQMMSSDEDIKQDDEGLIVPTMNSPQTNTMPQPHYKDAEFDAAWLAAISPMNHRDFDDDQTDPIKNYRQIQTWKKTDAGEIENKLIEESVSTTWSSSSSYESASTSPSREAYSGNTQHSYSPRFLSPNIRKSNTEPLQNNQSKAVSIETTYDEIVTPITSMSKKRRLMQSMTSKINWLLEPDLGAAQL